MGLFFGTDGLRGKVNDDLSVDVAFKCGNALLGKYPKSKILIGCDTRGSGGLLAMAFATGAMNAGAEVVYVGVCPTAGISFLTQKFKFDFGVVISASHNPAEFNGIKIFDSTGKKLGDKKEEEIEKLFLRSFVAPFDKVGKIIFNEKLVLKYQEFLLNSTTETLNGKTIVLDCANGASYKIAPKVFQLLGAKVIATHTQPDGFNINENCGSLYVENLKKDVVKHKADMGFAFDGDSDRLIAVDNNGEIVDGDKIIYLFACEYLKQGKLNLSTVVGTRHTNMGLELALKEKGINLIRTDIGDKYVTAKLIEKDLLIGGEQSGHVLLRDKLATGDGILNAVQIASLCVRDNKKLSEFFDFKLFEQCNLNVRVDDKMRVINSEKLSLVVETEEKYLLDRGRIMIRVSGTEPYIRIMVETRDKALSQEVALRLKTAIEQINSEVEN